MLDSLHLWLPISVLKQLKIQSCDHLIQTWVPLFISRPLYIINNRNIDSLQIVVYSTKREETVSKILLFTSFYLLKHAQNKNPKVENALC